MLSLDHEWECSSKRCQCLEYSCKLIGRRQVPADGIVAATFLRFHKRESVYSCPAHHSPTHLPTGVPCIHVYPELQVHENPSPAQVHTTRLFLGFLCRCLLRQSNKEVCLSPCKAECSYMLETRRAQDSVMMERQRIGCTTKWSKMLLPAVPTWCRDVLARVDHCAVKGVARVRGTRGGASTSTNVCSKHSARTAADAVCSQLGQAPGLQCDCWQPLVLNCTYLK